MCAEDNFTVYIYYSVAIGEHGEHGFTITSRRVTRASICVNDKKKVIAIIQVLIPYGPIPMLS